MQGFTNMGGSGTSLKSILATGIMQFMAGGKSREDLVILTSPTIFQKLLEELSPEDAKEATEKALALEGKCPAGMVLFDVPIVGFSHPKIGDKFWFMNRKGLEYMEMEGMLT